MRRIIALLQQLCIAMLLIACAAMLGSLWISGEKETKEALSDGKRFIVHVADGKVEGVVSSEDEPEQEAKAPEIPPPPPDTKAEEIDVGTVKPSSSPIAPVADDMVDNANGAPLPKIPPSGIKPWQYYAKPYRRQNELPMVAIVITGLGQSRKTTELAISLDESIGLGLSPYATSVGSWANASRVSGHEIYVELPFQTTGYPVDDPGPFSILTTRSNTENIKNLLWAMSRFQGYAGMVTPMNEVVTVKADAFKPIADELTARGVMLLTGRDTIAREDEKNPINKNLVTVGADVWIDEELSEMTIQARLATLEQTAQRNGMAIGYAQAYPLSITQIKHWYEGLADRGIMLVPVSLITKLKNN